MHNIEGWNDYEGHPAQCRGAEKYTVSGGRGDGMKLLVVRNGLGLELVISEDRAADIVRAAFRGVNCGYFSPCGYVAPAYYDKEGTNFLRSFTAGFFATCGLTAVGSPCEDEGEVLPLHGTISNTPAEIYSVLEYADRLEIRAMVRDCALFARKLVLDRTYTVWYTENRVDLHDVVFNEGDAVSPVMLLYHCNMGYPLLTEKSEVVIPHSSVKPRNDHAAENIDTARQMEQPQAGYEECCYYYDVKEKDGRAHAGIFNHEQNTGVVISFDKTGLDCFTEWKMMGIHDYVLGLEPGNCYPDGRDVMRKTGILKEIAPGAVYRTDLSFRFTDNYEKFTEVF